MAHTLYMCELIILDGQLPNAHKDAIEEVGDPIIEIRLVAGKLSDGDAKRFNSLEDKGHKFKIVTYRDCERAYLVATT